MTINIEQITIILAGLAGITVIVFFVMLWTISKYRSIKRNYTDLTEIVHGLNNDFRELYTNTTLIDERMNGLDERFTKLTLKLTDVKPSAESANTNHPYSLAIQKVRSGASVHELMQTAGLSQDEATLLIRLHGSKTTNTQ